MNSEYPFAFAGYGRKVMVGVLSRRLGIPWQMAQLKSRSIRLLWFMTHMGGGWYTVTQLKQIGAGKFSDLKYSLPDGVKDGLIDEVKVGERMKYRVTDLGKAMVAEADKFVQEEMNRSLDKIRRFKLVGSRLPGRPKGSKNAK